MAQTQGPPNDASFSGMLRKKKLKHGVFEDPYKTKVKCWIHRSTFYIQPINLKGPAEIGIEELDITAWEVGPRQAKAKFTVIHPSGRFAKFKAASQKEADEWMKQITSAAARAKEAEAEEPLRQERASGVGSAQVAASPVVHQAHACKKKWV